jgi:tRNA (cytidine/uridine-2'-O-)-methyltransferase
MTTTPTEMENRGQMEVVLVHPQIPQNTGNIVRTCAAVGAKLILVRPLGFSTADRHLRRAGLDYWCHVPVEIWDDWRPLLKKENLWLFSSKAKQPHAAVDYGQDPVLVFGSEQKGLPDELLQVMQERQVRIPMRPEGRCLNLAVSAGIALYAAWQQQQFTGAVMSSTP